MSEKHRRQWAKKLDEKKKHLTVAENFGLLQNDFDHLKTEFDVLRRDATALQVEE
jgi:ABC-type phosphate transport system auxiliary subunit